MEIKVKCGCGQDLEIKNTERDSHGDVTLEVAECEKCGEENFENGKQEGITETEQEKDDEMEEAVADARREGFDEGREEGYEQGLDDGGES